MVFQKRLNFGPTGYHVPAVPKCAKGKRTLRKKTLDNQLHAFDLLAAVAGKLLQEGEGSSSSSKIIETPTIYNGNNTIKEEQLYKQQNELISCDWGNSSENALDTHKVIMEQTPYIEKRYEDKVMDWNAVRNVSDPCGLKEKMNVESKPHALENTNSMVKVHSSNHVIDNSFSPRDEKLLVNRDDDENFTGLTKLRNTINKALKTQGLGQLTKTSLRRRICYPRQRTQRSSFKKRSICQRYSILTSNRGLNIKDKRISSSNINEHLASCGPGNFHVKLTIKSFKVPELFFEIPETSTVGSLKTTVMEAVNAILGNGLRVGIVHQGKKVRDDNKTLVQAGISHVDKLDDLGFTLEPYSGQSPQLLTCHKEPDLLPNDAEPVTSDFKIPIVDPPSVGQKCDFTLESPQAPTSNSMESDNDQFHSPIDCISLDNVAVNVPSVGMEAQPVVSDHKPCRPDIPQRRIRRPFSVTEVEALVHAVEGLGTGRWKDVKTRAFEDAKHRTYVDLKDKWKTLVHTAQIAPQQRRGAPVPQELLDRVLTAHAYWTEQQAQLQSKNFLLEGYYSVS